MRALKFLFIIIPCFLSANPTGEDVVHGSAVFSREDNSLIINQKTDKTIINWNDFSISGNEITRFVQPSKTSTALNRVIGNEISKIYGNLESNGKIYLINQKGILIGPNGKINTNGFVASTLDLEDSEFINGKDLHFVSDLQSFIQNFGTIEGLDGEVILIAPFIENQGTIKAKNEKAALLASNDVLLKEEGSNFLVKSDCFIDNKGTIEAVEIELKASNGNIYSLAINQEGIIKARGIEEKKGRVFLIADGKMEVAGKITSKSDNGGVIHILADEIYIKEGATIDSSSDNNGGEILIGGDFQGNNPQIKNAKILQTAKTATIEASAFKKGNGGKIIFWSDDLNLYEGNTFAKGGEISGNGGFVEVSCKKDLEFRGMVSTLASNGKTGSLLLDPSDITISTTSPSSPAFIPPIYDPATSPANLWVTDLNNALVGNDVTIQTTSGTGGSGIISIQNNVGISWSTNHSLTILADKNILFQPGGAPTITHNAASGQLTLTANGTGSGGYHGINLQTLKINSTSSDIISINGTGGTSGSNYGLSFTNTTISAAGDIQITGIGNSISSNSQGIHFVTSSISSTSGSITFNGTSGPGTTTCYGIAIYQSNPGFITNGGVYANGTITINGISHGSGTSGYGSYIYDSIVQSTGGGNISVTGTGSGTTGAGIYIDVSSTNISTAGTMSFTGTGSGTENGIHFLNGTIQGSDNSDIILTGSAPVGNDINLLSSSKIINSTGSISLFNDTYSYGSATNFQTSGALNISPLLSSDSIGVGDSAAGTLTISNATLQLISTNVGSVNVGYPNGTHTSQVGGITTALSKDLTVYGQIISTVGNINIGTKTLNLDIGSASAGSCTINNHAYTIALGTFNINGLTAFDHVLNMSNGGNNTWIITAANSGSISSTSYTGNINFIGMRNLEGGSGNDIFNIQTGGSINSLTFASGTTKELNYSGYGSAISVNLQTPDATGITTITDIANITDIVGDATLFGSITGQNSGTTTWTINGSNQGNVSNSGGLNSDFSNINTLIGGSGNDIFDIQTAGSINSLTFGSGITKELNYSGYGSAISINLQTPNATGITTITDIANITDIVGDTTLFGSITGQNSGTTTWTINGSNQGNISNSGGLNSDFSNINTLIGGSGNDIFDIQTGGSINSLTFGSGTTKELNYSGYGSAISINLQTPDA
ncbi:MAG: filamentous hemagglutinin N-terminal domain-containing protein, partial [Parachlamydiales bacterium]